MRYLLLLILFVSAAHANLVFDVSLLYKKGVDKDLVLTNEVQSKLDGNPKYWATLKMKNGFSMSIKGDFMKTLGSYGPSDMVQLQIRILKNDELLQEFQGEKLQTKLGWPVRVAFTDQKNGQMIELTVTPRVFE